MNSSFQITSATFVVSKVLQNKNNHRVCLNSNALGFDALGFDALVCNVLGFDAATIDAPDFDTARNSDVTVSHHSLQISDFVEVLNLQE